MFKYKGYQVEQTEHSIYLYQNNKFVMHVSIDEEMEEEELYQTLDFLITTGMNLAKKKNN